MLKFFRKIRYKLMSENKTGKYLKYAIGEIILVVIGILIALSINNWNESMKQNKAEKEFIISLKKDLTQDKEFINLIIKQSEEKDSIYQYLSKELYNLYDTNRPLLNSLLRDYFASNRTFYPIFGSFQSAVSGNEITKFKNKDLSNTVTKLYNSTYARIIDNGKSIDDRWFYLTRKYGQIRRTGEIPDMKPSELNEFLNDVYDYMYGVNYLKNNLINVKVEIDKLLTEN